MKILLNAFIIAVLLISCKKDIKLTLNHASPQIVIEGIISDKSTTQTITITKTVNFYDSSVYPAVTGAIVAISDNGNTPVMATETTKGVYQITGMTAVYGHIYNMSVTIAGTTYTAQSSMPYPVTLNDITFYDNNPAAKPDKKKFTPIPKFDDPVQYKNNYRFVLYNNGVKSASTIVRNDNITNGITNEEPLFTRDFDIISGDKVTIEMFGTDHNVYQYFFELSRSNDSGPGGTTPSNPESNISGGVLGYFSAQTYQIKTVQVP